MKKTFLQLDGRHKAAVIMAIVAWALSMKFSQAGFAVDDPNSQWVGWVLAAIVTVVELVFNSQTRKLSLTLIIVGVLCYLYGVWTNITGFWAYQHPGVAMDILSQKSLMSIFVGVILEVLPEPLFMWGIESVFEGDVLGNLGGLLGGNLNYATPSTSNTREENNNQYKPQKSQYRPQHKPVYQPQNERRPDPLQNSPQNSPQNAVFSQGQQQQFSSQKDGGRVFKQGKFHPINYEE